MLIYSTFTELDSTLGINVLNIPADTIQKLQEKNSGYRDFTIKAGVYSNESDIQTFAVHVIVFVHSELSEDTVYRITKVLNENREKWITLSKTMETFSSEFSVENRLGEMHPGAKKYYEEVGALQE